MPGYTRYWPYTLKPNRSGSWRAPNLGAARQLVAASGTRGMRISVWDTPEAGTFLEEGRVAVATLNRLDTGPR